MAKGMLVIPPETDGADGGAPKSNRVIVPKEALAIDSAMPSVGDDVNFEAAGKVVEIQGDNFVVEVTSANDQPVGSDVAPDNTDTPPDDGGRADAMDEYTQGGSSGS